MCVESSVLAESANSKTTRRILPFLFVLYVVSYVDRANLSFAKLQLSADLGFSDAVYGFGAGIFFLGYFLLEIPGALIAEKWSAPLWISRILITWGVCTICEGLVHTATQFYAARFCLGLAEAGFFPAVLVYLAHWFPHQNRARALSGFILSVPISFVIGAPISALCLSFHAFGISGWRWLFILQGAPAILLGIVTPFYLTNRPEEAGWLNEPERFCLAGALREESRSRSLHHQTSALAALKNKMVWLLSTALFLIVLATYGYIFWLPAVIQKHSGLSTVGSTLLSTLPFCAAAVSVLVVAKRSDLSGKYRVFAAVPLLLAGFFFTAITIKSQPFVATMFWLILTGAVLWAWAPPFWTLPTLVLGESAAAMSLGVINSVGNLGGFVGPTVVGLILSWKHSYSVAVWLLSGAFALGGLLIWLAPVSSARTSQERT